jgi:transcriptional regulator with XRE-family HTH domain
VLTRRAIGKRIRARRHHLSLSQEALAAIAGVSRETIRRLEAGRITPNLATLGKVADGLRVSASALLAERQSDELTELVLGLPGHEQQNMVVMLRALSDHLAAAGR